MQQLHTAIADRRAVLMTAPAVMRQAAQLRA